MGREKLFQLIHPWTVSASSWWLFTLPHKKGRLSWNESLRFTNYFYQRMCLLSHSLSFSGQNSSACFSGVACSLPFLHFPNLTYLLKPNSSLECEGTSEGDFFMRLGIRFMLKKFLWDSHASTEPSDTMLVRIRLHPAAVTYQPPVSLAYPIKFSFLLQL